MIEPKKKKKDNNEAAHLGKLGPEVLKVGHDLFFVVGDVRDTDWPHESTRKHIKESDIVHLEHSLAHAHTHTHTHT